MVAISAYYLPKANTSPCSSANATEYVYSQTTSTKAQVVKPEFGY
jgi:hypothetical protein